MVIIIDPNEKEKYKCKTYSNIWIKNASCLKEHIKKYKNVDAKTETSTTKHKDKRYLMDIIMFLFLKIKLF